MRAGRFFRTLIRLLPFDFRADYGGEIERTFLDQRRDARAEGSVSVVRVWWINIRDILKAAPREHLADLLQDAGYALRGMRRQPGFAAVVVVTLALGMGASTAMFAVAYTVLIRPLPYAQEETLVRVWNKWAGSARAPLSDPEYLDYAERTWMSPPPTSPTGRNRSGCRFAMRRRMCSQYSASLRFWAADSSPRMPRFARAG
jgi:hypothetical protein